MTKYIVLLRGINVGGRNKIKMSDLKSLLESHKYQNIQTYIQSGNIILESETGGPILEKSIHSIIQDAYGFDVPVIVRSKKEFESTYQNIPFPHTDDEEIKRCHVTFLSEKPSKDRINLAQEYPLKNERFTIIGREAFLQVQDRYSKSKLTNKFFESKLETRATTRNWKTMIQIMALLSLE